MIVYVFILTHFCTELRLSTCILKNYDDDDDEMMTIQTRHKAFPILGEASASLLSNYISTPYGIRGIPGS